MGEYPNNQIQMGCQFIPRFTLHKPQILKHLSFFMLPITMAIYNSISFSHSDNQWEISWLLDKVVQIFVHGLQSIGDFMATWQLTNIIILKKNEYYTNIASFNKGGIYNCFGPIDVSQNRNVLSKLKVVPKIHVQFQVAFKIGGKSSY
jgi:hypothetical protein